MTGSARAKRGAEGCSDDAERADREHRGRSLLVSRGVGSTEVALRTFADPDILIVEVGAA